MVTLGGERKGREAQLRREHGIEGGAGDEELGTFGVEMSQAEATAAREDEYQRDETHDEEEEEDGEEDGEEERAALLVPSITPGGLTDGDGAGAARRWFSSTLPLALHGVLSTAMGECVMVFATFVFALQSVVAKTVERGVPPMQVVFVRSIVSGGISCCTITQRMRVHNRRVAKRKRTKREADATSAEKWMRNGGAVEAGDAAAAPSKNMAATSSSPSAATNAAAATADKDEPQLLTLERFLGDRAIWHLCLGRGVAGSIAFSLCYISLAYLTVVGGGWERRALTRRELTPKAESRLGANGALHT